MEQGRTYQAAGGKRSAWIDLGRILATLIVVYYHLPSSDFASAGPIGQYADVSAGLAFFFVFAGYFVRPQMPLGRVAAKAVAMLLPFLLWNLLCIPGLNDELSWQRVLGYTPDGFCCDYPLWFCRDLIVLILLTPLFQRARYGCLILSAVFLCWGGWHSSLMEVVHFPTPANVMLYLTGMCLRGLPPQQLEMQARRRWWILLPVAAGVHGLSDAGVVQPLMSLYALPFIKAALILLAALAWMRFLPRTAAAAAPWAPACFLVYAMHAPAIIMAGKLTAKLAPPCLDNPWLLAVLPLLIAVAGAGVFALLRRVSPHFLLPLLAHEGRLPFAVEWGRRKN